MRMAIPHSASIAISNGTELLFWNSFVKRTCSAIVPFEKMIPPR